FLFFFLFFFFSSRRRHTRSYGDWSSDVCYSDLLDVDTARGDLGEILQEILRRSQITESTGWIRYARERCAQRRVRSAGQQTRLRSEERRVGTEGRPQDGRG